MNLPPADAQPLQWVVCLCAEWCGVCRDYRAIFEQVAYSVQATHPDARFAWVDVEDETDLIGDLDVETFPTVLIVDASGTRFVGPIIPQAKVLQRMLQSIGSSTTAAPLVAGAAMVAALAHRPDLWVLST